ncbi:MAG: outer membrane lipoprotein carrier protein LolA [Bacteroidales bacterium]|jgi:outer membrane lipoprotein-sorting protein|nr:outer membrane lipoprotein carrier protein LolA [Bacteroidales bacterium]
MKSFVRYIILGLVLLSVAFKSNAQLSHTQNGFVDEKAKEILSKCKQKIVSSKGISFTSQIVIKDQQKKEKEKRSAKVLLQGNKYRISVEGHSFYCDGTTIWHHNKETKEVIVNSIDKESDNILNPSQLLNNYDKNFRAKFIREENGIYIIDLVPKKAKEYHKIRICVAQKSFQIKKMEMYYYDSSQTDYSIEQYKANIETALGDFVFDSVANKGVEIIDMR